MKLTKNDIYGIKSQGNMLRENLKYAKENENKSLTDFINEQVNYASMSYNQFTIQNAGDHLDNKYYTQNRDKDFMTENGRNEFVEELNDGFKNARSNYMSILAFSHETLKNQIESRTRFYWLFHPLKTIAENRAMKNIESQIKQNGVTETELSLYKDLEKENANLPESADIDLKGGKVQIDFNKEKVEIPEEELGFSDNKEAVEEFSREVENPLDKSFEIEND